MRGLIERYWCAFVAFGCAFAVYLATLCPTVYVEGSGELIGAVYLLGTAHPTGYPLFCLLGRLFTVALPFVEVAYAVNVASAFTAALAVGALALLLRRRGADGWASLGGGMVLAFSGTFWSQAVIAEVYGLSSALVLLVILCGLRGIETRNYRLLLLTCFSMGLGFTAHLSQALVWPGLFLLLVWKWRGLLVDWRRMLGAVVAFVGGYSLVLYLPLRNERGTGFHWGPLDTPGLLWDHLTGAIYRSSFFALPPGGMLLNARRWLEQVEGDFHFALIPLFAWGLWNLWRRDRNGVLVFGGMVLANLVAALNYHRDPNGIGVFFLLSMIGLAVFAGYALDDVGRRLGRGTAILLGVVAPMGLMALNWTEADRSGNRIPYRYGRDILDDLPVDAVLIAEGDDVAYVLDYLKRIEGLRGDVRLLNRVGRGTDLLVGEERGLSLREQSRLRRQREGQLIREARRPLYYLAARQMPLEGFRFAPEGLVYRVVPEGMKGQEKEIDLSNAREDRVYRDPWVRKIQANYWFMKGEGMRESGRIEAAVAAYEQAGTVAYDSRTMRFNVAVMLYRLGRLDEAWAQAEAARAVDPWQANPYRLMAHIARRQGRLEAAKYLLKRADFFGR